MASEIKANKISPATGTAFTIGDSGDTFTVPSGATLSGAGAITVPSGGSLTIDSGATITNNGTNGGGFGKVLQVVQDTKYNQFTTTSTTLVAITGLEATITPASTSSTILVMYTLSVGNSDASGGAQIQLYRDSTAIYLPTAGTNNLSNYLRQTGTAGNIWNFSAVYKDNPATTSAVTYSFKMAREATGTAVLNRRGGDTTYMVPSSIVLMEIEG